jgi:hypothetical protein
MVDTILNELTPEMFGAVGDGSTNDTAAFQALGTALTAAGGGMVIFRAGAVYLVGGQTFAGATGKGYSYQAMPVLTVSNVNGLHIAGNGARMQLVSGLKYGSFDPVTGNAAASSTSADKAATIGSAVRISSSKNIVIENLTVDGALATHTIGGNWDPPAIQLDATGLRLVDVENIHLNNVLCSNNGLDGIYLRGNRRTQYPIGSDNLLLTNVDCNGNGRQGMSWVGGHGLTVLNSRFRNTSQASSYNGNPAAGVDIEPNNADWASQALFLNCSFENNLGVGLLADTGNSRGLAVRECEFWAGFSALEGVTYGSGDALWTSRANLTVENCRIHGTMTHTPPTGLFRRCSFDDAIHPIYGRSAMQSRGQLLANCPGAYEDCTFNVSKGGSFRTVFRNNAYYRRCVFSHSGPNSPGSNSSSAEFSAGDVLEDCSLSDSYDVSYGNLYLVDANAVIRGRVVNNGPSVGWGARLVNGGFVGELAAQDNLTATLRYGAQTSPGQIVRTVTNPGLGTATWLAGDIAFNRSPAAGGKIGWVCTAAGSPGTWKPFGLIDA